jgi:hypothetical protein
MTTGDLDSITGLLDRAGQAHGQYEQAELNGVYDQQWAAWYAAYAVEHGLGALLGHAVSAGQVAAFFTRSFAQYQRDGITEPWSSYTARALAAEAWDGG